MTNDRLASTIAELGIDQKVSAALQNSVAAEISIEPLYRKSSEFSSFAKLGFMYEVRGLALLNNRDSERSSDSAPAAFASALACWTTLSAAHRDSLPDEPKLTSFGAVVNFENSIALRIAVAGLVSGNSAETRLRLRHFALPLSETTDWLNRVATNLIVAFVCLVRKDGGWADISRALQAIDQLRSAQKEHELSFLERFVHKEQQTRNALCLVGFYHLAQIVTSAGEYLRTGSDGKTEVTLKLDTHHRKAAETFDLCLEPAFRHLANLIWAGTRELIRNALWSHLEGTSDALRDFGRSLISASNAHPVLELWPSQQEALRKNLLDTYQRAILVEMPTSAGKTLLAKFAIAQTKALNKIGRIAYLVPTRALVNQITLDLRRDFAALNYSVEQAVPAYELDPTESQLLSEDIDILVTTPEKLDLLIRANHTCVRELSLVVADEAHNLEDGGRGARLELLLGTIKRERRNCRFLLLSPFLPNGRELVTWLGDDRHLPPIQVQWRPSKRLVAAGIAFGRGSKRCLALETLSAADNTDQAANFSQYLYSTLITNASWGIGALESLCLAGQTEMGEGETAHVPSMIYFGVHTTEAVWLRMAGLPRLAAEGAAAMWREKKTTHPTSYADLRKWVSGITSEEWSRVLPRHTAISPASMKVVWNELSGLS